MPRSPPFATRLKTHLTSWAPDNGIGVEHLEVRGGRRSLVLTHEHRARNLFDLHWWRHIEGKEHRWARALNSSQCFAVNLFAPLVDDEVLAARVTRMLLGAQWVPDGAAVRWALEYTPEDGPAWLGERGQPTQVDACAQVVLRDGRRRGWLVEVKLAEAGFGGCRGALPPHRQGPNPDVSRCLNGAAVIAAPDAQCWLVQSEGRSYWQFVLDERGSFRLDALPAGEACPFRHGLYQLMRNQVLADVLVARGGFDSACMSACVHPENEVADLLPAPVLGQHSAEAAFARITTPGAFTRLDPAAVLAAVVAAEPRWQAWGRWLCAKYLLQPRRVPVAGNRAAPS